MSHIALIDATKSFGTVTAVDRMTLDVEEGELVALLGGSGCGKTTTLRLIAGFAELSSGDILINGRSVKDIPAHKRNIGVVFQNYALFPHLTVLENVAFGLTIRKLGKAEIAERVGAALAMVKLAGLESRLPRELSGGQQQRVALARALVMRPTVLLLDEPLSNLDAKLRREMQTEIRRIQKEVGITTILVTHDQEEAISLADRIAVMRDGIVMQVGSPEELFRRPSDRFVADFMGFDNFIEGRVAAVESGAYKVEVRDSTLFAADYPCCDLKTGTSVILAIRAEHVELSRAAGEVVRLEANSIRGRILTVVYKGTITSVTVLGDDGSSYRVDVGEGKSLREGDEVDLRFPSEKVIVLPNQAI